MLKRLARRCPKSADSQVNTNHLMSTYWAPAGLTLVLFSAQGERFSWPTTTSAYRLDVSIFRWVVSSSKTISRSAEKSSSG